MLDSVVHSLREMNEEVYAVQSLDGGGGGGGGGVQLGKDFGVAVLPIDASPIRYPGIVTFRAVTLHVPMIHAL